MSQRFFNHNRPIKSKPIKTDQGEGERGWNRALGRETRVNNKRSEDNSWGRRSSLDS